MNDMATGTESRRRGWRGSAELWLDAAYEMLIEGGVEAVKVMPLAKALNLSRTSFYWHFADREALLSALIERWREKNTGNLVRRTQGYAETITEAVLNLFDCWITPELFDARLDFALRNWAHGSPDLRAAFERADRDRIAAINAMFLRFGYDPREADVRARTIYLTQVGYIAMRADEPAPERVDRMPAYVVTFTGHSPRPAEVQRFLDRHRDRLGLGQATAAERVL
jgi:AcrR family transcriptional regulator